MSIFGKIILFIWCILHFLGIFNIPVLIGVIVLESIFYIIFLKDLQESKRNKTIITIITTIILILTILVAYFYYKTTEQNKKYVDYTNYNILQSSSMISYNNIVSSEQNSIFTDPYLIKYNDNIIELNYPVNYTISTEKFNPFVNYTGATININKTSLEKLIDDKLQSSLYFLENKEDGSQANLEEINKNKQSFSNMYNDLLSHINLGKLDKNDMYTLDIISFGATHGVLNSKIFKIGNYTGVVSDIYLTQDEPSACISQIKTLVFIPFSKNTIYSIIFQYNTNDFVEKFDQYYNDSHSEACIGNMDIDKAKLYNDDLIAYFVEGKPFTFGDLKYFDIQKKNFDTIINSIKVKTQFIR